MTVIVSDSFNRTDSTSLGNADTGQTWVTITGAFKIISNRASVTADAGNQFAVIDAGQSDQIRVSAILNQTTTNPYAVRLAFRVVDTNNLWFIDYSNVNTWRLMKRVAGTYTQVSTATQGPVLNNPTKVSVELNGSEIKWYFNDVLSKTVTDTALQTATKHGIGAEKTYGSLDDFLVESLGGDTGTDGSITLGLTQQIYSDSSVNLSLSQKIYADISANLNLIQTIYKDTEAVLNLNQAIYRDTELGLNLRQEIYAEAESILNLIQEFYEDSQTFITLQLIQEIYKDSSTDLSLTQSIYKDGEIGLPLRQEVYESKESNLSLTQNVYKDDTSVLNLSQSIYKDSFSTLNLVQQMYVDGEINLPLLIQIRDDFIQYNEVIRYVLNVTRRQASILEITQRMQSELKL